MAAPTLTGGAARPGGLRCQFNSEGDNMMKAKVEAPGINARLSWRRAALLACGSLSALIAAPSASAQETAPDNAGAKASEDVPDQEIVVTATRVERSGFLAPTPTTIVSADDFGKTGATSIGSLLNRLPQFQGSSTPTTTPLGDGITNGQNRLDLRGLGAARTLVLVDGKRFVPTNVDGSIDTNLVPSALIERFEVVTGGASASWGSDAVAGVVNIILKKRFVGVEGTIQSGISSRGDNAEKKASLAFGADFAQGKGHFMAAGEIVQNDGILAQSSRPWGNRGYQLIDNPGYAPGNGQSRQLIAANVNLAIATRGGLFLFGPPGVALTQFAPGGQPVPFHTGDLFGGPGSLAMVGGDGYNPGVDIELLSPFKRQVAYSRLSYDFSPSLTAYVEGSYGHSSVRNDRSYAPAILGDVLITPDNYYLPTSIRNAMTLYGIPALPLFRYSTDFGFTRNKGEKDVYRIVGGLEGKLGSWKWKASYEYGVTDADGYLPNDLIMAKLVEAADVVASPVTGAPVCRSTLTAPGNGCLPINLFGEGSPNPAAVARVVGTSALFSRLTQQAAAGSISGEPFSTWAGPISIAAGVDYRREEVRVTSDPLSQADAFQVGNAKPLHGAFDVIEGFGEAVMPLLSGKRFAKQLDLSAAVRVADYSTSGRVTTWKVGLSYEINDELRLRATRSRDIRAPNLNELFRASELRFGSVSDPATNSSVSVALVTVGNTSLQPERADTISAGLIYQPHWLRGFRLSADYYDIKLAGAISTLEPQAIVDRCAAGNADLCNFVKRNGAGTIQSITQAQINLGNVKTNGVDVEAAYVAPLGTGHLTLRLLSTYVAHLTTDDGVTAIDHAGDVGADAGGIPHWRATGSISYDQGPLSLYLAGRYVGGGKYDHTASIANNDIPGVFYLDGSLQFTVKDTGRKRIELTLSANNLLDKAPPIAPSAFFIPIATNAALYDVIGRTFTAGVRFAF